MSRTRRQGRREASAIGGSRHQISEKAERTGKVNKRRKGWEITGEDQFARFHCRQKLSRNPSRCTGKGNKENETPSALATADPFPVLDGTSACSDDSADHSGSGCASWDLDSADFADDARGPVWYVAYRS